MAKTPSTQEPSQLSPLEWVMPRSYISQILCFPSTSPRISEILRDALAGTLADVPYLASAIVAKDHPKSSVALSPPCDSLDDLFRVQNLDYVINYEDLKSTGFQPPSFDVEDLFSADLDPAYKSPSPVFRAVLSLVKGGCLLVVSLNHSTADITAFGALLKIWASHCRTGSSEDIQFNQSWLDRTVIASNSHNAPAGATPHLHRENKNGEPSRPAGLVKLETQILRYSAKHLKNLKDQVGEHLPEGTSWVSTSDILTALLWGTAISAEFSSDTDGKPTDDCWMRIAVNCRKIYNPPLPKDYLGAAFGVSLVVAKKADLLDIGESSRQRFSVSAIANVAAAVRQSINGIDEDGMNATVKFLNEKTDITGYKLSRRAESMSIVSWADEGVYELDWGTELGRCEAVRLPTFKAKRYPVVFPKLPNGDLEVLVSFEEGLMNRWKERFNTSPWKA